MSNAGIVSVLVASETVRFDGASSETAYGIMMGLLFIS
jgi:hypothetical protein